MINCPVQPYEFLVETVDILETPFDIGDLSKYPNDYIISTNLHGDISTIFSGIRIMERESKIMGRG